MKFSRYLIWNFLKMFLIVVCGAILIFVVIDFVGNIKTWLARDMKLVWLTASEKSSNVQTTGTASTQSGCRLNFSGSGGLSLRGGFSRW